MNNISLILTLVVIVVLVLMAKTLSDKDEERGRKRRMAGSIFLLVVLAGGLIYMIPQVFVYKEVPDESRIVETVPLVAINDNIAGEEQMFLSLGDYSEDMYYFGITGTNETGYKQVKIRADDKVSVFEIGENEAARIEHGEWFQPSQGEGFFKKHESVKSKFTHIFVPKDTIIRSYEIDAK